MKLARQGHVVASSANELINHDVARLNAPPLDPGYFRASPVAFS
jgi:hypothetical protein